MLWVWLTFYYAKVHSDQRINELVPILQQNKLNEILDMVLDFSSLLLERQQQKAAYLVAQLEPEVLSAPLVHFCVDLRCSFPLVEELQSHSVQEYTHGSLVLS